MKRPDVSERNRMRKGEKRPYQSERMRLDNPMKRPEVQEKFRGENHPNWQGGKCLDRKEYLKKYNAKYNLEHKEELKPIHKRLRTKWYQDNKELCLERAKIWQENNPEKVIKIKKGSYLMKKYKITLEEVDKLLIKQNHKCAICGSSLVETRRCIDHNHETGKVRGILCHRCNIGLGYIEDGEEFVSKCFLYLEEHK